MGGDSLKGGILPVYSVFLGAAMALHPEVSRLFESPGFPILYEHLIIPSPQPHRVPSSILTAHFL